MSTIEFQSFVDQGAFDLVERADAVLHEIVQEFSMAHGLRVLLEPIRDELSEINEGQGENSLSDWKDEVECCQGRLECVLDIFDFIEVHEAKCLPFLAALDLLRLAKAVIDAQVQELYSRPHEAPTSVTMRARSSTERKMGVTA